MSSSRRPPIPCKPNHLRSSSANSGLTRSQGPSGSSTGPEAPLTRSRSSDRTPSSTSTLTTPPEYLHLPHDDRGSSSSVPRSRSISPGNIKTTIGKLVDGGKDKVTDFFQPTGPLSRGFGRVGDSLNKAGDTVHKQFLNVPLLKPFHLTSEDLIDAKSKTLGWEGVCTKCESLALEACYTQGNPNHTEANWITPLARVIYHADWCRMCRLLLSMLCRPELDPLKHPEVTPYMPDAMQGMDMKTWVGKGWRFTDKNWPFGRNHLRHEGATHILGPTRDVVVDVASHPEFLSGLSTFVAFMVNSKVGKSSSTRSRSRLSYADGVSAGMRQMEALTKYPMSCVLHMTILTAHHPEFAGMAFVSLVGYGNRPEGDPQLLSHFRLRVAHPAMLQQQDHLRSLSYGKVLDRDWIDLSVVRQWLAHCTQSHGKLCSQHSWGIAIQPPKFLRVIDVCNLCLVEVVRPEHCRFVALSYVWGRSNPVRLRYNNVDSMKRPQGLRQYMSSLPRTIIDAMEVVRGLDEKYLWVDSLCILQEDSMRAREQIATMDRVYGSAFFTIVAAQGSDADHGLRGIKRYHFSFCEPGRPRIIDQPVAKIKDDAHIIAPFPSKASLADTTWNTRAWTFQERILSKRILAFCGEEVVWHCRKMVCREDMQCEDSGYGPESLDWLSLKPQYFGEDVDALWVDGSLMTDRHGRTRVVRSGTFGQYSRMVEEYTSRHLTFESDAIRALEGLLHIFQLSFRSEFTSGLPKSVLDVALLWRPMQQLQRRRGFPSWSWTGWKGQVSYNKAMEVQRDDAGEIQSANRAYSGEEGIRSLERWYTFSSSSSRLEPINGHGWGVPLSRLPAEWEASLDCSTGRTGRTLTSDPLQLRSYVQATLGNRLLDGDMTYLILCTTCTRSFQLGNQILQDSDTERITPHGSPIPPESRPLRFSIVGSAFEWIGTVLLDGTGPEWMDKQTHEFILISEAQYFGLDDEPYNVGEFPLYHVMLVEHDLRTGISTRLGLGRVRKTAWMMAEPTERVVILG